MALEKGWSPPANPHRKGDGWPMGIGEGRWSPHLRSPRFSFLRAAIPGSGRAQVRLIDVVRWRACRSAAHSPTLLDPSRKDAPLLGSEERVSPSSAERRGCMCVPRFTVLLRIQGRERRIQPGPVVRIGCEKPVRFCLSITTLLISLCFHRSVVFSGRPRVVACPCAGGCRVCHPR